MNRWGWFILYLAIFWAAIAAMQAAFTLLDPSVPQASLRGLGIFVGIVYFAWLMPRTGRKSWMALGMMIPFVNAYLFFSSFSRLAGQREGVRPPVSFIIIAGVSIFLLVGSIFLILSGRSSQ